MTPLASREMTEQEMINTSTAPQMAHLIQVLRQTIRNKDKEIERWVDMVRDGELDPPEPQPTYKVGDWVEYKKGKHHQVDSVHDGCCYLSYGKGCGCFSALYSDITRKLDPSEVVIRIGCLSGTVTYAISDDCFLLAKVNDPQHRACCIDMSMLDTPTREMVESLLAAQEEK